MATTEEKVKSPKQELTAIVREVLMVEENDAKATEIVKNMVDNRPAFKARLDRVLEHEAIVAIVNSQRSRIRSRVKRHARRNFVIPTAKVQGRSKGAETVLEVWDLHTVNQKKLRNATREDLLVDANRQRSIARGCNQAEAFDRDLAADMEEEQTVEEAYDLEAVRRTYERHFEQGVEDEED